MVSRSDPGSFQRTTTCIWMPDVRLLHYFEPTQCRSVSGLDDGKRKTKRGWSPGDSLNLVCVLSVRVNYNQQCRNDINGRWEYSKSIIYTFSFKKMHLKMLHSKCWPFCLSINILIKTKFQCIHALLTSCYVILTLTHRHGPPVLLV